MPRQQVLIAGCGYVGTALAHRLAAEGTRVTVLRRSRADAAEGILALQADLVGGTGLGAIPDDIDTIFYTVGADGFSEAAYRNAYVVGLQNLLHAVGGAPRRLIYTSSTGVYAQDAGEIVDESSETVPTKFSGRILLEGEAVALASHIPSVVVRFGGIYGPGRTRLLDSVRAGSAYALSDRVQYLNLIHRDDCAGVLRHVMMLERPETIYNAVDDVPMERGALITALAGILGVSVPPPRLAGETADPQRGGNRRVSNARLRNSGYVFAFPGSVAGYTSLSGHQIDLEA